MVKSKSPEYWEKRVAVNTWKTYNSMEEGNRKLLEFYQDASRDIRNELYDLAEKYSKDGVLSRTDMYNQRHYEKLQKRFDDIILSLGRSTEKTSLKSLQDGFREVYKDTAVGMGDIDYAMPNKKLMEKLLEEPWRGGNFSNRLWKNQKKLVAGLNDILRTGLQQGKTVTEMAVNLHNYMGQGFNECHRLVRSESMHYLNSAAMQRYKDAGVGYVQIWAALDERTCEICGVNGYHGKVYPIDKCPVLPFHPNCRCTIIPCFDLDLIEKSKMNDRDTNSKKRTKEMQIQKAEVEKKAKRYADTVQKYSVRESRWSGNIVFDDEKCHAEHVSGRKLWSCDILLKTNCQEKTIIHEQLHACSGSYLNPITYIPYGRMEEASVELLAREICKQEGIPFTPNKNRRVEYLYEINQTAEICETDIDFATALFAKSLQRRYNWLESKVEKYLNGRNVTGNERARLLGLLSELKGHK